MTPNGKHLYICLHLLDFKSQTTCDLQLDYKKTLLSSLFLLCIFPLTSHFEMTDIGTVHKLLQPSKYQKQQFEKLHNFCVVLTFTSNCSFDFHSTPPFLIFTLVRTWAFRIVWGGGGLGSFGWTTNMIGRWGFAGFNQDQGWKGPEETIISLLTHWRIK